MKKIFLALILLLFTIDGFAQFKGNPGKAKSSLDKAALKTDSDEIKELLTLAKGEIDAAIDIEKQRQKANTWLIRGDVYAAIAKGFLDLDSEAIEKAIEAYDKIGTEVTTKDINIIKNTNAGRQNLSVFFVNQAIAAINETYGSTLPMVNVGDYGTVNISN